MTDNHLRRLRNPQDGSAHVVIIIVLVVALLGALGWIFWQNFLSPEPSHKPAANTVKDEDPSETTVKQEDTKLYDTDRLSFEYPSEGWVVTDHDFSDELALIETSDYQPNIGMGIDSGAYLGVYVTTQSGPPPADMGASDVTTRTIAGTKGYSYKLAYEGHRLQAIFSKNGQAYNITMQYDDDGLNDSWEHAFDMVLDTIKIK